MDSSYCQASALFLASDLFKFLEYLRVPRVGALPRPFAIIIYHPLIIILNPIVVAAAVVVVVVVVVVAFSKAILEDIPKSRRQLATWLSLRRPRRYGLQVGSLGGLR